MNSTVLASSFARFAANARKHEFAAEARQLAVDSITDSIGCFFAGASQPIAHAIRTIVPLSAVPGGLLKCPCPTLGGYTTSADAALYMGSVMGALDYDDVSHPGHAHPSEVMVPALLAATPHVEAQGRDFVSAYLCGFELMGKLGRVLNPGHFEYGWHPTPTLGPLMSALAVGSLLRLSEERIIMALGIAASGAAGVRANFGTMVKPFHAGQASRAGVVAALLAREGFTSSAEALEHRFGYFACFRGDGKANLSAFENPGESLEILSQYGHALKPYPACAATHPGIEAAITLHRELRGHEIASVHVGTAALTSKPLIYPRPETPLEGKFSLEFCVAAGLVDGRVDIDTFSEKKIGDPAIRSLMRKMSVDVDDEYRDSREYATAVTAVTASGRRFEARVPLARGKPGRRLTEADIAAKFRDCTEKALGPQGSSRLYAALRAFDGDCEAAELARSLMTAAAQNARTNTRRTGAAK